MYKQEVIALIDKSGSMIGKEEDTIQGINECLNELRNNKETNTTINISIKFFNSNISNFIDSKDINNVDNLTHDDYDPRGGTAIYDSIGKTIDELISRKQADSKSFDSCLIYIMTDGVENSSRYYNCFQIKELVKTGETDYNIKLIYLGANQDAIFEASKIGVDSNSSLSYKLSRNGSASAYKAAASVALRQRSSEPMCFTDKERLESYDGKNYNDIVKPVKVRRQ